MLQSLPTDAATVVHPPYVDHIPEYCRILDQESDCDNDDDEDKDNSDSRRYKVYL